MASAARSVDLGTPLFASRPDLSTAMVRLTEVLPELARLVEQAETEEYTG
jgi:hypothetical protein